MPNKLLMYLVALTFSGAAAAVGGLDFTFEPVAEGFVDPVKIASAGDGRLFVVSTSGQITVVSAAGNVQATPYLDIRNRVTDDGNEQGLLGLAFHPQFELNGYLYVNYTRASDGDTVIARFTASSPGDDTVNPATESVLLTVAQPTIVHNAGDLAFGNDGYLYIPMGDGRASENAQDPSNLLGAIIRIDVDMDLGGSDADCSGEGTGSYLVPASNPSVDGPGGDCDEIWATGLRNPFRFSIDRDTGDLYIGDVGQLSFEEVNFQPAGQGGMNWGWPCKEGFADFNPGDCQGIALDEPFFAYGRTEGQSVIGGFVYRGAAYPGLRGVYFFHDFFRSHVWAARRSGPGNWVVTQYGDAIPAGNGNVSSWGEGSDGELYIVSRGSGVLMKLVDNASPDPNVIFLDGFESP